MTSGSGTLYLAANEQVIGVQLAVLAEVGLDVVIQADGEVPHKRVIHLMDLLSQAHVSNIAFAVDVSNAPQGPPSP